TFKTKVIRNATTSPDGKTLVFNAVGYLWKKELPKGKPVRLTQSEEFEFEPKFSPDGKQIVYVTWSDQEMSSIRKLSLANGSITQLTTEKGIYRNPSFSNDGKMIVFAKKSGNNDLGHSFGKESGIYLMSESGEHIRKIYTQGDFPVFNIDDSRVFIQTGGAMMGGLTKTLKSIDLNGEDERVLVTSKYANRLVPSPDNKWIAFTNLHKAYLAPLVTTGKTIEIDPNTKAVPVSQITKDAGLNLHWSNNSQNIHWTLGDQYYTNEVSQRFTFLNNSPEEVGPISEKGIAIGLEVKTDVPSGTIAFTNAHIITMDDDKIIENGTIIIRENKIENIGSSSEISVPADAKVYDVQGKTIMPGMVDAHAHIGAFRYGLTPQQHWPSFANLAYGVTTVHDPSALSETIFSMAELVKSGDMVGPRIFST